MLPNITDSPSFASLKLSDGILASLDRLGFTIPTPIQYQAIPPAIEGCDIVGIAQTGTGKTLAFGLPLLDRLLGGHEVALILAPTRELALQINEELTKVAGRMGLRTAVLIGGAPINKQITEIKRRPQIIVATPGRLKDHLYQRTVSLRNVSVVILDEADRMFDMGFAPVVREILNQTPKDRQTLLFSATMAPEVLNLTKEYLRDPVKIEIAPQGTPSELVDQELHVVEQTDKGDLLAELLYENKGTILVFARTRHGARKVAMSIRKMGHSAAELHSDRTLAQRKAALFGFKSGEFRVLVATDIAARGIDVKEIELVINYDLPDHLEDYVHRIGRTGRAGATGRALTFLLPSQQKDVRVLERILGRELPVLKNGNPVQREAYSEKPTNSSKGGRPQRPNNNRNERPSYQNRSEQPRDERPARPTNDAPQDRPRFEKRDERPSGDKPRFERRDDRPVNQDRPARPFNNDRGDRPNFQNREDRPARPFNNDRGDRPNFKGRDDRSVSQDRPARPFNNDRGDRPNFQNREDRPARPFNNDRVERPNTDRPRFPANNDRSARPFNNDRPQRPNDASRGERPKWQKDDRGPAGGSSSPKRFGAERPASNGPSDADKGVRPKPSGTPKKYAPKPKSQSFIRNPNSAPAKKFGRK